MTIKSYFCPPDKNFAPFECSWPENGRASSVMAGESATLIGWMPESKHRHHLRDGYLKEAWSKDLSIRLLLGVGNQRPPDAFDLGPHGLMRYLDAKDFRGAISLAEPTLYIGNGRPVFLHWRALGRPGYTPYRVGPVQYSADGTASRCGDVYFATSQVVVRVFLRMKLGFIGQLIGKGLTWHWPPWATLMVEYAFDLQHLGATVSFCGTAVPSQRRYVDWRLASDYEIETELSREGYQGFVEAGGCYDAMAFRSDMDCPVKNSALPAEVTIEQIRSMRI